MFRTLASTELVPVRRTTTLIVTHLIEHLVGADLDWLILVCSTCTRDQDEGCRTLAVHLCLVALHRLPYLFDPNQLVKLNTSSSSVPGKEVTGAGLGGGEAHNTHDAAMALHMVSS